MVEEAAAWDDVQRFLTAEAWHGTIPLDLALAEDKVPDDEEVQHCGADRQ